MRSSGGQLLWRITGFFALLSFLLFGTGFLFALDPHRIGPESQVVPGPDQSAPAPAPPLAPAGKRVVVTLGDSLTRGTGDANGLGYVGLIRQALEKQSGNQPIITNLAINGLESSGLLEQLKQAPARKLISQANLIMFTIGGNDLFHQAGGVYTIDRERLAETIKKLATNYTEILTQLRKLNPNATIVYLSLYNPFGDTEAAADTTSPVLEWNSKAAEIASHFPRVIVVPTYDLFVQKEKAYLYSDHFHPNSVGYERMAERILQALK